MGPRTRPTIGRLADIQGPAFEFAIPAYWYCIALTLSPPAGKSTTTTGITDAQETAGGEVHGSVRAPAVRVSAPGELGVA
ncbi:MAG TPA: hypothetical protein VK509_13860, partial [Polyangiales bacterium]|nr:hypothetical protein [Polyangiales bacterium]